MFITGGCLMNIEVTAGLTIAPFFGSSVFVWGSVIGVFMAGLSLGYAVGGRLAERSQRLLLLSALLLASGLLVLLVPWYGKTVSRLLLGFDAPSSLSPALPLAAAALLYFPPTALLGMISPVAVRIRAKEVRRVGSVVGRLYSWNALGSVAGGLVTTFILAPFLGTRAILTGCALVLIAAAFAVQVRFPKVEPPRHRAKKPPSLSKLKPVPGLLILVFACGVVTMSFEVIAGAQIAPYFGSTVFAWGSVISIFLVAMTLGYRLGGKMVDRRPSMKRLSAIVIVAGFLLLLLPLVTPAVCQAIKTISFGSKANVIRPLFAAGLLFFCPTLLLSMVAPFSVRLATEKLDSVGGVAGRLYALSTLGNMAGVLLTTFVLIPLLGKTRIFETAGMITLLSALFALFSDRRARGLSQPRVIAMLIIALAAGLLTVAKPELIPLADADERVEGTTKGWSILSMKGHGDYFRLRRLIDEAESPYHHIAVIEERAGENGESFVSDQGKRFETLFSPAPFTNLRKLKFDQFTQSSIILDNKAFIRQPLESGTTYTDMLHLPFVFNPDIHDVLIIGGGGGVVPMIFKHAYSVSIDVVEIDPAVVKVARKWFGLEQDAKLRIFVQDGRMFICKTRKLYDLIILDVYTAGDRIPFHLTTHEFLLLLRDRLQPDGIAVINLISALKGSKSQLFWAEFKTFQQVFGADHVYVFPERLSNLGPLEDPRNIILVATGPKRTKLSATEIVESARRLKAEKRIPIASIPQHASRMLTEKELSGLHQDAPLLTDDYAPVDMMMVSLD
jgi:spermidine synthase/MFS family permease